MNELIGIAMIVMGIALLMESIVTLFAIRATNESYERYIAEIKYSQKLEKQIEEKDRQYNDLAKVIREVSEEIEDGE